MRLFPASQWGAYDAAPKLTDLLISWGGGKASPYRHVDYHAFMAVFSACQHVYLMSKCVHAIGRNCFK